MKPFTEQLRYDYPLTEHSIVLDLGAYHGEWSAEIARLYNPHIFAYEPIYSFYQIARLRLRTFKKVSLFNVGVAPHAHTAQFGIKGDMTGEWTGSDDVVDIQLVSLSDILPSEPIDLLKLNIEGGEYGLLEHILDTGIATRFKNIQVQFHGQPSDALARWISIFNRIQQTHDVTYLAPFCWENYSLR